MLRNDGRPTNVLSIYESMPERYWQNIHFIIYGDDVYDTQLIVPYFKLDSSAIYH